MRSATRQSTTASPRFVYSLVASDAEVDELGHVSNVAYVRWIQEAARAHSTAIGWGFDDYKRLGAVFVVRRIDIEYLRPVYAGDAIELTTWVESWRGVSSVRRTKITVPDGGPELARADVQWVLVDVATGRPRRIPAEIADAFWRDPMAGSPPA